MKAWFNIQGIDYLSEGNGRVTKAFLVNKQGIDDAANVLSKMCTSLPDVEQCKRIALEVIRAYKAAE